MVAPLLTPGERADLVLGVRPNGLLEAGAMPWHARLGNAAVAAVLALRTGRHPWDLSPWKALRADTLRGLELDADGYAWTVQLVARALRRRDVAVVRRAVWFRRRSAGRSKVSGSWRSSLRAGGEMLFAALSETRRRPIIALVAKPAEPGLVKTRLAASIGNQAAAEFWRASLGDLGERLGQLARRHGYDPVAVVPSSAAVEPVREIVGPAWQVIAQAEPGLAGALRGIFSDAGRAGAPSAVVIAGDNPTLPTDYILRAFEAVRGGGRAVLGPAFDGGYYLVGMSTHRPPRPRRGKGEGHNLAAIFRDEAMGTSSAGASARQALGGWSDRLTVLAPWLDVDTIDDLRRLAEAAWDGVIAPRTAAWLRAWQADAPPMMSDAGSVPSSP